MSLNLQLGTGLVPTAKGGQRIGQNALAPAKRLHAHFLLISKAEAWRHLIRKVRNIPEDQVVTLEVEISTDYLGVG